MFVKEKLNKIFGQKNFRTENNLRQKMIFGQKIKKNTLINHAYFMTNYPQLYLIMHVKDTILHIQQNVKF